MNELAALLGCDNSNVTGLIDRLEGRGLVARQPSSEDRRVKHVVLTPAGRRTRGRMLERVGRARCRASSGCPPTSCGQLRDLLRRVLGDRAPA